MLRAYIGFNAYSETADFQTWLFRIMTNAFINGVRRAHRRSSVNLSDHITDRQPIAQERHPSRGLRSTGFDALDALQGIRLTQVLMTLLAPFRTTHGRA
jgi:RNA polymerase sigma-70 factor (ECF subfamily)